MINGMQKEYSETAVDPQHLNRLLTVKIVGSYLRQNSVDAHQVPDLIASVHQSLGELGQDTAVEEVLTPAVSVRQSVRHDYVVCLDCGYQGQTLRRHINSRHGLSRAEYLRRWGLKSDHPLTAPAYSENRSALAKQLGLGRKTKTVASAELTTAESATATPAREIKAEPRATTSRSRSRQGRARPPIAPATA
jgi:MucR family transcriptional regulator, transcriptional regulator of exopolysaccharide biosynthesis